MKKVKRFHESIPLSDKRKGFYNTRLGKLIWLHVLGNRVAPYGRLNNSK